jgi:hypothetical protein
MTNIVISLTVLVSSALTLFLLNGLVRFKLKNKLSENENPITVPLFKGVLFISGGLLLIELVPSFQTLTKILPGQFEGNDLILREISFYCIFLGIVLILFAGLLWFSTLLFSLFQRGDNIFVEVANNNIHSLITFSAILLTLTLAFKSGITPILDGFIPYPTMPVYR